MNTPDPMFARWAEIDALFDAALQLPPDQRIDYLRQECGLDHELFELSSELIASAEEASSLLRDRTLVVQAQLELEAADEAGEGDRAGAEVGRQIGAYRLVEHLGRGGTGTVYRAERVDGAFEQEVAIKLLRRGLDTDDTLTRFRTERQILASLNHPNIARLFDGGVTEDGRPYLVMEYVDGQPITEYCDARRLTIEERLRIFLSVGRAIEYAHRNLVVHRDLKPSNILVGADGGVKLLDFGIAKLIDPASSDALTRTGMRLLTPEYASPEQFRGDAITTASDVYQLGVLLCQLLTGSRPVPDRRGDQSAVHGGIGERPVRAPSSLILQARRHAASAPSDPGVGEAHPHNGPGHHRVVARPDDLSGAGVAAARGTDLKRLRRRLRGDLDTLVLVALREQPERRFASVAEFMADVERHLKGEPLAARPESWSYRARKLAGRHPGWVMAVLVGLLAAIGYVGMLARHTTTLAEQHGRAVQESERAQQLSDFLLGLFEANDPDDEGNENGTLSAFDLVLRGQENAAALHAQPALQAEMYSLIGSLYTKLGEYDQAEPLLREAVEMRRALGEEADPELARALIRLSVLLRGRGQPAQARPLLREAVVIAHAVDDAPLEAEGHLELGMAYLSDGDHAASEQPYRTALELLRREFGERHEKTANGMHSLGLTLFSTGRLDEAEELFTRALEIKREVLHQDHSSIAASLAALSQLQLWKGEPRAAARLMEESLAIKRARLGDRHPRVGDDLFGLGQALSAAGAYEAAEAAFRESLSIGRQTRGERHGYTVGMLSNLAHAVESQGRLEEALDLFREAAEISYEHLGESSFITGTAVHRTARLLHEIGRYEEAEAMFREAIAIFERARPGGHPNVTYPLASLGQLLIEAGRHAEAAPLLRTALDRLQAGTPEDSNQIASVRRLLDRATEASETGGG